MRYPGSQEAIEARRAQEGAREPGEVKEGALRLSWQEITRLMPQTARELAEGDVRTGSKKILGAELQAELRGSEEARLPGLLAVEKRGPNDYRLVQYNAEGAL